MTTESETAPATVPLVMQIVVRKDLLEVGLLLLINSLSSSNGGGFSGTATHIPVLHLRAYSNR